MGVHWGAGVGGWALGLHHHLVCQLFVMVAMVPWACACSAGGSTSGAAFPMATSWGGCWWGSGMVGGGWI